VTHAPTVLVELPQNVPTGTQVGHGAPRDVPLGTYTRLLGTDRFLTDLAGAAEFARILQPPVGHADVALDLERAPDLRQDGSRSTDSSSGKEELGAVRIPQTGNVRPSLLAG